MTVEDATANANFTVEIDGIAVGGFFAVTFPTGRVEVVAYRERNSLRTRLPAGAAGARSTGPSACGGPELRAARLMAGDRVGQHPAARISVGLLDASRQEVQRWNVIESWPASYDVTDLAALGNDVVLETIEIIHEGLELAQS